MNDDERVVRDSWERAEACPSLVKPQCCISLGGRGFTVATVPRTISGYAPTEAEAWRAARLFTEARQEEVRKIDREIAFLTTRGYGEGAIWKDEVDGILQRLRDIRAGLTRGMKGAPDGQH